MNAHAANTANGSLITFEGGEGGGKTTQVVRLRAKLIEAGHDVIVVREPGGTTISEQIREVTHNKKNTGMAFTTEMFLFQAARAQIFREVVIPSLESGKVVIMDRSRDSSVVYQGMVRGFDVELIDMLNDISTKELIPDLTILLDVPVDEGLQRRMESGKQDRLDLEARDFHEAVREAYLELANEAIDTDGAASRWRIIDASQDLETVEDEVWDVVESELSVGEQS